MAKGKKLNKNLFNTLFALGNKAVELLEKYASPLLLLAMRLWIANVFFKSGMAKFSNMSQTVILFEYEYGVPLISPLVAAYMSVTFELICPIFLALGLATRLAVLPLIGMALVIQFLVEPNIEHYYWLFLMASILIYGAGKLSADSFVKIKSA
ncbi:MAG: DoxX family protein [Proteobacteria bacterium]|nr:DoxX family protein [Pseudomonadota bacterium]